MTSELNPSYELRKSRWGARSVCTLVTLTPFWGTAFGDDKNKLLPSSEPLKTEGSSHQARILPQSSEVGLEIAYLFPPARPAVGLSYSRPLGPMRLSLRLHGSWTSLSKTFSEAAQESSYANRLSAANGQLRELSLSVPEVSYTFRDRYFLAIAPILRGTDCVATYSTVNENSLQFESAGLSIGVHAIVGLRTGKKFKIELASGIQLPITSIGTAGLNYTQASGNSKPDFSDQELESILNSLQPYAKELSEGFTLQFGVRGLWEI